MQNNVVIETLKELSVAVTGSFDLDTLLQNIVEMCTKSSKASRGALFLYDDETKELVMRAEKGNAPELRFNARYKVDVNPDEKEIGLTAYIFLKKEILVLNSPTDIENHPAHKGKYDDHQYPGTQKCQSWVGIPLIDFYTNTPIGVLKIENTIDRKPIRKFSEKEIELFKMIAAIASQSIIKLQRHITKISHSTNRLSHALDLIGSYSLKDKLKQIVSMFKEISHADGASIWIIDGSRLICKGGVGHYDGMEDTAVYSLNFDPKNAKKVGLTAWIAKTGEMLNIKSYKELVFHPQHKGTYDEKNYKTPHLKKCESFIGAPLKIGDQIIGVIKADNRIPDSDNMQKYFSEEEAQIFSYLAIITAVVVKNAQDFENARTHDKQLLNLYKIGNISSGLDNQNRIFWNLLIGLTHQGGIGFNRAILFEYNDSSHSLSGLMGVGPLNIQEGKEIQLKLNSASCKTDLFDCLMKNDLLDNELPQSELQKLLNNTKIEITKDCKLPELINSNDEPKVNYLKINELCENFTQFLNIIETTKTNESVIIFSLRDENNKIVVGLCDYIYSTNSFNSFNIHAAETFINQISLIVKTLSLKKTEEEMREKAWREFSAITAHRIRTETANMIGAFKWIREEFDKLHLDNDDLQFNINRLASSIERMSHATREYIELARPALRKQETDINSLISSVIDQLKTQSVEFICNLSAELPYIHVDQTRIAYALTEIIHNSMKAMKNSGKISVSTCQYSDNMLQIVICDSGPGISPNILPEIFKIGYYSSPGGTGLGLHIVKKYITEHDGKIEARSNNEALGGATFTITLPLPPACSGRTLANRILLVEDNEGLRYDIKKTIKSYYKCLEIIEAENEYIALEYLKTFNFDFVISDIMLNEAGGSSDGGIKILEAVKSTKNDIIVILMTSHGNITIKNDLGIEKNIMDIIFKLGADHFVLRNDGYYLEKILEVIRKDGRYEEYSHC